MKRHLRNISLIFLLLSVHLAAKATVYYVTYEGLPVTDGWQTVTTLDDAISKAVANDEIWIQGSQKAKDAYKVPFEGYTIKSGVKIYGGFKGTETNISQREYVGGKRYKLKYRTMLTGDIKGDDKINDTNFIFPIGEATNGRTDNADHVLILDMNPTQASGNNNTYPTIVNGLTIARGHNKNTDGKGAGIYVTGDNTGGGAFRIEQCFFLANYAPKGGAVYIEASVKHRADDNMIDRCAFFNNAAGTRNIPSNEGAAIYAQGQVKIVNSVIYNNANGGINAIRPDGSSIPEPGDVQVINSTITRNSASGIEGKNIKVYNTVVWGNTTISSTHRPNVISHCAFIGAANTNGNVSLAEKNLDTNGPAFATPSLKIGYDSDFSSFEELYPAWNWESQGETTLVDKGDNNAYTFGNEDLVGDPRISGNAIDIGAYEYQPVATTHIRYVKQGGTGDGTTWDNASGNLQRMIDDLAETGGEVWVAAGTYEPVAYLVSDKVYTASFRMRDNVSVYGGFAGTELSKNKRAKGTMPWIFTNETILQGQGYKSSTWGDVNSSSRHVVWFAPLTQEGEAEEPFTAMTHLDGVTIEGGYASGGNGAADFLTDRGAGIYMKGSNVSVTNCIVRNNYATGAGGGIYMDGGGRVERTLVFNNVSNDNGGAVYMDGAGIVRRCMLANNQGRKGAGAYLKKATAGEPDDLQLSTCVVSNNTSTHNGAVYCDNGGVVVHNTIVNNLCSKSTDTADGDAAQTGGLYIDGYAQTVNTVLWNNRFISVDGKNIPVYIKNPSTSNVRFLYNAISGTANAVWNSTYQEGALFLADGNTGDTNMPGPDFEPINGSFNEDVMQKVGVQTTWTTINYYWPTAAGSALWSAGLEQGRFPSQVQVAAELDIAGNLFSNKPSIGASYTKELVPVPNEEETDKLILYVSSESMSKDGDGSSWEKPFRSINKAIAYFAGLDKTTVSGKTLEIRVLEGDLWPRFSYVNEDSKSATINLLKTPEGSKLRIVGGYYRIADNKAERDPLTHRSIIEGNREGKNEEDGVYHVLTAEAGAIVELDGFHIVNGYAAGQAVIQHGAGLLAYDGADVTLVNCIFEDNTAMSGAAVYAEGSAKVTMRNCVVNNNTNNDTSSSAEAVVYCANNANLNLEHVSFINNEGAAPANLGSSSFAAGNTVGTQTFNMATTGAEGAANFANPSNDTGAKLGFDTYLGGYAVFRPLTSSNNVSGIINKATGTSPENKQDITAINDRDLGGVPDLGAYEAELPKKGTVIYVRDYGNTTNPGGDGSSWDQAINGNSLNDVYKNNHGFQGYDAELYAETKQLTGLQWAVDEAYYRSLKRNANNTIAYTNKNVYKTETPGSGWKSSNLQVSSIADESRVQVWVAAGEYLRREGFFMRDGVDVFGGFPSTGNPGENDRQPRTYETIIETNTTEEVNSSDFNNWGQYLTDTGDYISEKSKGWKVVDFSSEETGGENGMAANAIDGNENTLWHTIYNSGNGTQTKNPHHITIDLGEILNIKTVNLKHRRYGFTVKVYLSETLDDIDEKLIASDSYASSDNNNTKTKTINLGETVNARFLKLEFTNPSNSDYADIKEIGINGEYGAESTYYDITHDLNGYKDAYKGSRVLTQPFPYYVYHSSVGDGISAMELKNEITHGFAYDTSWDGLIIQNGRTRIHHQRDGGAGLALRYNGHIKNCIIRNNVNTAYKNTRGGGCFQNDGIIENSVFTGNDIIGHGENIFGGALYIRSGIVFNTLFSRNRLSATTYSTNWKALGGAAIFFEVAKFYNNTITKNVGRNTVFSGNYFAKDGYTGLLEIYNTIIYGNDATESYKELDFDTEEEFIKITDCLLKNSAAHKDGITNYSGIKNLYYMDNYPDAQLFNNESAGDYSLHSTSPAINKGTDELGIDLNNNKVELPSYDADYTDRVKDCTVDIGAYERINQDNVAPDITTESGKAIYYVTQNGAGTANGNSLANAACAMKLQEVLNVAGNYAATNTSTNVIVKVAGYEGGSFTYHVNTLAYPNNPQSYSYSIPYGVTVMGGYNENALFWNDNDYKDNTYTDSDNKEQKKRDITKYRTVFSGIKQATSTTQEVQGYHTVTFKGKPEGWTGTDKQTIIDGVYIQDGSATSLAGGDNDDTKGGAAIVPAGAHVRNCVIQNNEAKKGGGLYVLPGGWVSGCVIKDNTAEEEGGGIYAKSDGQQHAYLVSNTIAENTALQGGGVYIEEGAAMTLNSVIWSNHANSDKNVSAAVNEREADTMLDEMIAELEDQQWYPFNNCYVESIELPYNLQNTKMESTLSTYFANENYVLKYYSPLIDHGMVKEMQTYMTTNKNVATHDMQGLERVTTTDSRMDVGAFAFKGKMLDDTKLLKRIFVSHNSSYVLDASETDKDLMGKTFYTPFTWLGDALEYIRTVRENVEGAKDVEFEIFVAAGTYTPKYQRQNDTSTAIDLRQNSFIIPYGVKIYGGFTGEELYSSHAENEDEITSITFEGNVVKKFTSLNDDDTVKDLVALREGSDFNDNKVVEAWEMAEQTILSGNINLSNEEQNVYHVIYSEKDKNYDKEQNVLLDGVTIQDGRTLKTIPNEQDVPKGRGGGIYSNGVNYTVVNSRLLNNKAVRGGAAFIQDANLTIVNSMVAGNEAWKDGTIVTGKNASGGGVFAISTSATTPASLKAVNTLWANNESVEFGGAIGAEEYAGASVTINLMNNTFVMNNANNDAVLYHTNATTANTTMVNTLMWGNVSEDDKVKNVTVKYSASDHDYTLSGGNSLFGPNNGKNNILLSQENLALDGPRMEEPSTVAGLAGYDLNSKWNPIAVSPLTDHGNGMMKPNTDEYEGTAQAYKDWFTNNAGDYVSKYMLTPISIYKRYSGPNDQNGNPANRPIDIGVYEYQYVLEFSKMEKIYVATKSSGKGTGESWQNATDDLRGALIGAANPTDGGYTRNVYIKGGDYPWPANTSGNSVFPVHLGGTITWTDLNIIGSCTGAGEEQDFSKPTVIRRHPYVTASNYLMEISATKPVTISGLTFSNSDVGDNIGEKSSGVKVASNTSTLTMKHVAFRNNPNNGLDISSNSGKVLLVNALFADNVKTGLNVSDNLDNTILVNTTFANNGTDMTSKLTNVYNSTSWKNGIQNMKGTEGLNNKVFATGTVNNDIEKGPNFYDPSNTDIDLRDYRIRPSLTLLNTGSNVLYAQHALGDEKADLTDERDLYNVARVVDSNIDIGAYEYRAPMQQIIYVKEGIVKDNDGKSWETALTDLQNAANLAGIFSKQNSTQNEKKPAYVFVHNNVDQGLNIQLENIKVYGGMNDEVTQQTGTDNIVNDLLNQRAGLLERTNRSQIKDALTISGENSVVDGFEVNVSPTINKGMLATSVVNADVTGATGNTGILYNSLVKGDVSGIRTVNVTATRTIAAVDGYGNNRPSATGNNKYLTSDDGWNYQLNETSTDIDAGTVNITEFTEPTGKNYVGHNRDIAGNKRVRNTVDNGCFETWNITKAMEVADAGDTKTDKDCIVRDDDYPHGKSVVYVRHDAETNDGAELLITKNYTDAAPFNPGFLLLEHHAGLRANNKAVGLTHFAVERNIGNSGKDMAVMPFEVTKTEVNGTEGTAALSLYNAAKRAGYSYKFSSENGAWTTTSYNTSRTPITTGWLLEGAENSKARFYGNSYVENVNVGKNIELMKNNFNEPWSSSSTGGNKFTHKENMSWNLFGSPYLCAMNYSDMEYGRVMYGYQNGAYTTLNTIDGNTEGYIPAGDAVFTQTATLKSSETFTVEKPTVSNEKTGTAYQGSEDMTVALSRAYTRAEEGGAEDRLQLKAVPAEESRNDFDINGDGVKWMSANTPQIYARQNGGRYSLLSAVNIEGEVNVGITLPEAGMYTFSVPEDCDADAYETVVLKDNVTGKLIDLLEGQYDFSADEAGEIEGRFTISFNRMVDDKMGNDLRVWCPSRNKVCLQGTESGDVITIYSASGVVIANRIASSSSETISAIIQGVAIVEVQRNGQTMVRKVRD